MERSNLQQTYTHFKPQVDSLVNAGYEFHYFNNGFEKTDLQSALNAKDDSAINASTSYWALLQQLDAAVQNIPVCLFTNNQLNRFNGSRPGVSLNLHWQTYTVADSSTYIRQAYAIPGDSMRVVMSNSTATGITNSYKNVAMNQLAANDFAMSNSGGGAMLSYKNGAPVMVDTATMQVVIYTDKFATDAGYVKAAIDAVQQFSKRKITTVIETNPSRIPANTSWLFWLSAQPLPASVSARNIVAYQSGTVQNIQSWVRGDGAIAVNASQPGLFKRITPVANNGEAVWRDGFGNAVLQKEEGNTNLYRFYSRFDPAWNDLPWNSGFPQMMFSLLLHDNENAYTFQPDDKRIIDEGQLQPYIVKSNSHIQHAAASADLSPWCWLVAFVIFFIERVIASRVKRERRNG